MTLGMFLVNMNRKNVRILFSLEPLTPPLYAVFFAIAGTELNLKIFADTSILIAGIIFILLRCLGKYFGVFLSATSIKLEKNIRTYLGLSLLPQAGVAIGLVLFVQASPIVLNASPEIQENIGKMINIILMSVFFNEIVGPPLSKIAILKNLKRR
jgi:Kef-type K+ transport system membrane component KefB